MGALKIKILILIAAVGSLTVMHSYATPSAGKIFRKHSLTASDTSELNRYIRNAWDFGSNRKTRTLLKQI